MAGLGISKHADYRHGAGGNVMTPNGRRVESSLGPGIASEGGRNELHNGD